VKWLNSFLVGVNARLTGFRNRLAQAWADWRNPPYRTKGVQGQLPATLAARTLYIVQEDGYEEQAAMLCPCGCKQVLHMNLLTDERPCWTVTVHADGTSTLHPSVWRQKDCLSHFWFRQGRVIWCR
jgi:hypothetical protein